MLSWPSLNENEIKFELIKKNRITGIVEYKNKEIIIKLNMEYLKI